MSLMTCSKKSTAFRASGSGLGCRRFESSRPDHFIPLNPKLFVPSWRLSVEEAFRSLLSKLWLPRASCARATAEHAVSACGWMYRFGVEKTLFPAKYVNVYGSMWAAHRVRHVWRSVYKLNGSSFASVIASRCYFLRLDFSMWLVRVGRETPILPTSCRASWKVVRRRVASRESASAHFPSCRRGH